MERYCGDKVTDVIVPRDLGAWGRFQSQERCKQWGEDAVDSFGALDKSSLGNNASDEDDFSCVTLMDELEMECVVSEGDQVEISGVRGGISESSNCWTTLLNYQDFQLHGFPGTNQTDENFVNSLIVDDMRVSDQFLLYGSPKSQGTYAASKNLSSDMLLDSPSYSNNLRDRGSYEKQSHSSHQNLSNTMNNAVPQYNAPEDKHDQSSVEEIALQDLGSAMQKMTDKTRLSFRDAFYRLANNSDKDSGIQGQNGDDCSSEKHSSTSLLDQLLRAMENGASESRANAIDRTIAELMLNKAYRQINDDCHQGRGSTSDSGNCFSLKRHLAPRIHYNGHISGDVEVPMLCAAADQD